MHSGSVLYLGLTVVLLCSGTFIQARYAGEISAIARLLARQLDSEKRELPSPSRDVEDSSLLEILSDVSKKTFEEDCKKYCGDQNNAQQFGSEDGCRQALGCVKTPVKTYEEQCRESCEDQNNVELYGSEDGCMQALGCADTSLSDVSKKTNEDDCKKYCGQQTNIDLFGSEDGCLKALGCADTSEKRELPSPSRDVEDSSLFEILSDVSKKTNEDDCKKYCGEQNNIDLFGSEDGCLKAFGCDDTSEKRELPSPSRDVEDSSLLEILSDVSKRTFEEKCNERCEEQYNIDFFGSEDECRKTLRCGKTFEEQCREACEDRRNVQLWGSEEECVKTLRCSRTFEEVCREECGDQDNAQVNECRQNMGVC